MAKITINGKICNIVNKPPAPSIVQANPAKIFNKQWPDIILANKRNASDTTRNEYETNSIITNKGANANGAPGGKNNDNRWTPCVLIPIIFIDKNAKMAKPSVITIWLVTVKLYGIIPIKLQKKMNEKIVNNIGKKYEPFFLTFSVNTLKKIKSYKYSNIVCDAFGINFAL